MKLVLSALVAVGAVLLGTAPASATSLQRPAPGTMDPALRSRIDALAKAAIGNGVTGVIVGISDPVNGNLLAGYGTSDRKGTPMTPDLHYRIASVTKTFTATAVLQLVDRHRLSLDDRLSRYVRGIPNGDRITVRDLLAMRSGLYDYADDPSIYGPYQQDPLLPGYTNDTALKVIRDHAPLAAPDTVTHYSNTNYLLLGLIMEKVTGEPAPRTIERLARRSGLTSTSFPTTPDMPKPYVHGYLLPTDPGPDRDVTRSNMIYPYTAGAVVSTVPDMLRYASQLGTGAGLSPATFRERLTWGPLNDTGVRFQYGLGITQLGDWVGHNGSIFGYSDVVTYLSSAKASVVVMVNAADGEQVPAMELWGKIVTTLYPTSLPTW
ncbi:serine hydrolase domain-containing protein [Pseudonocardia ailaonensis]|uniref:serine hydrolase domain-containing protein n=1 Tax=Pseudonocardia ailaonensis TaxID=367279 RepID=UPI0031DF2CFC